MIIEKTDYNNIIFIQDKSIAQAYTLEFNEMWGGFFVGNKENNTPHNFVVNGINIEIYFKEYVCLYVFSCMCNAIV